MGGKKGVQDNIYVGGDGGDNLYVKIPWGGGGSDEFLKCAPKEWIFRQK